MTESVAEMGFPKPGMVLDAFGASAPKVRGMTEPFFDRHWIDAELRAGKRSGAFCSYITRISTPTSSITPGAPGTCG